MNERTHDFDNDPDTCLRLGLIAGTMIAHAKAKEHGMVPDYSLREALNWLTAIVDRYEPKEEPMPKTERSGCIAAPPLVVSSYWINFEFKQEDGSMRGMPRGIPFNDFITNDPRRDTSTGISLFLKQLDELGDWKNMPAGTSMILCWFGEMAITLRRTLG